MHGCGDGGHENGGWIDQQAMKRRHPVCNQPDMRCRCLVGESFPFGEPGETVDRLPHECMEEVQVIEDSLGRLVAWGDHDPWAGAAVSRTAKTVQQCDGASRSRAMCSEQAHPRLFVIEGRSKRDKPGGYVSSGIRHELRRG